MICVNQRNWILDIPFLYTIYVVMWHEAQNNMSDTLHSTSHDIISPNMISLIQNTSAITVW
jgi:hypothetical protein